MKIASSLNLTEKTSIFVTLIPVKAFFFTSYSLYVDCKNVAYEGEIAMNREEAIKLWNVSLKLSGNPISLSLANSNAGNESNEWKYVGRKRRTAL